MFNAARVIGPCIAGLLIGVVGTGGAFILNGLSYVAVLAALFKMKIHEHPHQQQLHPLRAIKEGISYSYGNITIRITLLYVAVLSIFAWSYTTMMPLIAKNDFNLDATGLGYLFAAAGLGSLIASFSVSIFSKKISRTTFLLSGNLIFSVALLLFTWTYHVELAFVWLFFNGLGLLFMAATLATMIQTSVDDQYRGRVMSIYTLVFIGLMPVGNLEVGYLSDYFGPRAVMQINGVVVLVCGIFALLFREKIKDFALSRSG